MLKALSASRWDFRTAAHLLNRAGFGGTPAEIEELARLGHERAVERLVDFEKIHDSTPDPDWAHPEPDLAQKYLQARRAGEEARRQFARERQRLERERMIELRGWWLKRMAEGPRPFQEKMTLFWHGHFATSVEKVRQPYLMWRQNELFRRMATGNWLSMLIEVAQDPAMLVWLDQAQSRKQHANENFAREVMELFTLGEGHYTEKDVTEAARALTGWSYDRAAEKFKDRPSYHDDGLKTIFGQTGNFDAEDFLEMIVRKPQSAKFITAKIWKFFAGSLPSESLNTALADAFRESGNNFKPLMKKMFSCEEFYAPDIIRNQVKSPVQWLVGSVRMLERPLPPAIVCYTVTRSLGQDLFAPPNVKGWDGGLNWITTSNLLARYNDAAALVNGDVSSAAAAMFVKNASRTARIQRLVSRLPAGQVDPGKIFTEKQRSSKEHLVAALEQRLLQDKLKPKQEAALRDYLAEKDALDDAVVRQAIRLVMSTPEYQLT
ncbi:MAG TPA: DUF1800 domain-containing protein [Verrucomicrobiae bacterium]|nr:DUF1800 domain-containing protein [Verrucomicrobiae bacterium]